MATTTRTKTPNRGAADEREVVKDWAKRYARKHVGEIDVQATIGDLLSFLATRSDRTATKTGGLGKR